MWDVWGCGTAYVAPFREAHRKCLTEAIFSGKNRRLLYCELRRGSEGDNEFRGRFSGGMIT